MWIKFSDELINLDDVRLIELDSEFDDCIKLTFRNYSNTAIVNTLCDSLETDEHEECTHLIHCNQPYFRTVVFNHLVSVMVAQNALLDFDADDLAKTLTDAGVKLSGKTFDTP